MMLLTARSVKHLPIPCSNLIVENPYLSLDGGVEALLEHRLHRLQARSVNPAKPLEIVLAPSNPSISKVSRTKLVSNSPRWGGPRGLSDVPRSLTKDFAV